MLMINVSKIISAVVLLATSSSLTFSGTWFYQAKQRTVTDFYFRAETMYMA